jgi:O-antigen/teichoic acid export membrane protein
MAILLLGLSILIAIPATIFAGLIIKIIFGTAFMGAVLVLQIYIWSNIPTSLNMLTNYYLVAENHKKMLLFSSLSGMIINIALNIFMIPKYGIAGAAYATIISYSIPFLFIFIILKINNNHIKYVI